MPPIYLMAFLTLAVTFAVWGSLLYFVFSRRNARYFGLVIFALPFSLLVNRLVKGPLAAGVAQIAEIPPRFNLSAPVWYLVFLVFLSPLTEELIKVLPLLIPAARRLALSKKSAIAAGYALGLGFGLGEAAYLAYTVASSPLYANLPWYAFTGYATERFAATFAHCAMTAVFASGLARGWKGGILGYGAAVLLHAFVNLGAALYQLGLVGVAGSQLPFLASLITLGILLEWLRRRASRAEPEKASEEVIFER